MKTLIINAQPDFGNPMHFTNKMQEKFASLFGGKFDKSQLTVLNLYDTKIPQIDSEQLLSVWKKQQTGEALTSAEKTIEKQHTHLLEQFLEHHRVVIVMPLHNFNITARMKDYIDNLMIARKTFRYTGQADKDGKVSAGLLTDDRKALLLYSSGSVFTKDDFYKDLDFAPKYLRTMLVEMMGFDNMDIVRVEGTSRSGADKEAMLAKAMEALSTAFEKMYG
ncbi:MAG: NAD(P)H-dependent oxidoreductase [Firmicutes bacterium]|nr:NAD(P)H-dependent oxidoreductase [Bacillota bacterium]